MIELVVLIGLQASGKSTFRRERFDKTHLVVSKDRMPNNRRRNRRQAQLIEEGLSEGLDPSTRSGYVFAITEVVRSDEAPPACNGSQGVRAFFVSATPLEPGVTGQRFFGTNSTGTIFQSSAPVAATFSETAENATVLD